MHSLLGRSGKFIWKLLESYRAFKSGLGRFFVEEGRLKEHSFWNGRFMDLLILAVYRETWAHHTSTMLKRFHPGS